MDRRKSDKSEMIFCDLNGNKNLREQFAAVVSIGIQGNAGKIWFCLKFLNLIVNECISGTC
jgi:hypothetical protein